MKWMLSVFIAVSTNLVFASECVSFIGDKYCKVWKNEKGDIETIEYLRKGQTLKSWDKMITVKKYSDKSALKLVLPGYVKSVNSMFAIKPEILTANDSIHDEEVYLLMLLLAPDKSHYEYVVNRFYRDKNTVKSIFYSHKIPFKEKVNFTEVEKKKYTWLEQLRSNKIDNFIGK